MIRGAARPPRSARGFSLIELMVALVLGLIVTGAVISTFISVHSASKDTSGIAELADNGRMAIDILQQSLRSAGYMACNSALRQASTVTPSASDPLETDLTEALAGYEAAGTAPGSSITLVSDPSGVSSLGDWSTTSELGSELDPSVTAHASTLPLQGSDVIAVHTTFSQAAHVHSTVYTTQPSGTSSVTVQDTTDLTAGGLGIVSNCSNSVVDPISDFNGNTVDFAQPLGQSFDAGAQVGIFDTVVYYIGRGADGDGALYSYSLAGDPTFQHKPTEIAPDVENMQILYGVDTGGAMAATEYVPADQVASAVANNPNCPTMAGTSGVEFNCVVSVKIALLVASPPNAVPQPATAPTFDLLGTTVTAPRDTRLRQVFETTVTLRDTTD